MLDEEIFLSCFYPSLPGVLSSLNQVEYKHEMFSFLPFAMLNEIPSPLFFQERREREKMSLPY